MESVICSKWADIDGIQQDQVTAAKKLAVVEEEVRSVKSYSEKTTGVLEAISNRLLTIEIKIRLATWLIGILIGVLSIPPIAENIYGSITDNVYATPVPVGVCKPEAGNRQPAPRSQATDYESLESDPNYPDTFDRSGDILQKWSIPSSVDYRSPRIPD